MNTFSKLRFPKASLALFIIGMLVLIAIPVRIILGAPVNLPPDDAGFQETAVFELLFPVLIIGLSLLLRNKRFRFMDLGYPLCMLSAIMIFVYFHFTLIG